MVDDFKERGGKNSSIQTAVINRYSRVAVEGKSCCDSSAGTREIIKIYSEEELASVPEEVKESNCACGNPVAIAELKPGQVVLDLGSGAGLDVLLASQKVGHKGKVIGIDATDEMVAKANKVAKSLGLSNVEFRKGLIENLPVEDSSVDVIISNCVINLVTDKEKVFREAFRVLKSGGKLAISDRVLIGDLPSEARESLELWSACVSGAIPESEYLSMIEAAGFVDVRVTDRRIYTADEAVSLARTVIDEAKRLGKEALDEQVVAEAFLAIANDHIVAYKP
ncbi:MAG: arsenite methyltransferase [Methanomassiliicoccales archaeon]|nr:arsenite methyltransferase [Methanomassiliicoccales archaeon]